uniref:Uncharacterized protein n=1 Tax=Neogobius melanostomus TaxID=47308 RepID=A0A8C6S718_9GOBI
MLCGPPPTVLSPIKRQTFCVQDSPLKQLPPAFQNRILKPQSPKTSVGSRTNCRPAGRPQTTQHPVTSRPTKSVSSPATGAKTQSRMSLRGRSAIGVSVLPSRPTAPKAPQSTNKNPADRSRLQPRSKLSTSWRRSPTSSRNGSCEDLLSDSASVASDVSDCSLNSNSSLGKHAPVPPSKSQGVRTRSGVKPPSDSSRRKTSSSSSSVSSFNSSFSPSPANKGKRSSSQTSLSSMPQSKPALTQKRRSVAVQPPNPPLAAAGRRSLSVQPRKPSNPIPLTHKNSNPTPLRRPESPLRPPYAGARSRPSRAPLQQRSTTTDPRAHPNHRPWCCPLPSGAARFLVSRRLKDDETEEADVCQICRQSPSEDCTTAEGAETLSAAHSSEVQTLGNPSGHAHNASPTRQSAAHPQRRP